MTCFPCAHLDLADMRDQIIWNSSFLVVKECSGRHIGAHKALANMNVIVEMYCEWMEVFMFLCRLS